jgi:hypothetical protein
MPATCGAQVLSNGGTVRNRRDYARRGATPSPARRPLRLVLNLWLNEIDRGGVAMVNDFRRGSRGASDHRCGSGRGDGLRSGNARNFVKVIRSLRANEYTRRKEYAFKQSSA